MTCTVTNTVVTNVDQNGKSHSMIMATHEQARLLALIIDNKVWSGDLNFCHSIATARKPSKGQMEWVVKKLQKYENPQPRPVTTGAPTIDVTKIVAMFQEARQNLKRPKITLVLDVANINNIVRIAYDEARGVLWLNSESFGQNYGRVVIATGAVQLKDYGRQNQQKLMQLLGEFAKDPITLAIAHGKLTGNCMFCQLKLTDERSLHHGYGKRCARNWHLPWGERPNLSAVTNWVVGE